MNTNKVIDKYDGKTIRVAGKVYRIRIAGEPSDYTVFLSNRGIECVDSRIRPDNSTGPDHLAAWDRAMNIAQEIEDAEEVDIIEEVETQ